MSLIYNGITSCLFLGITTANMDESAMSGYAFLAGLAYTYENQTQGYLDEWYGVGVVTNDIDTVNEFKRVRSLTSGDEFKDSAVSYRFFNFGDNAGIVSIRGTSTIWDLMADAQLWLPATLFQTLRFFLPMGNVFTPILHRTTKYISTLESASIEKVAFYKETASFVNYLKDRGYTVLVTGHSLGGGLALITGAQTDTVAIGMSA
jgi:lipase ATG15